ncbi:hypothetical protein GWK08_11050 [Leptobacterium flavescens]|uniref:SGNH/GDSL hydrolase family protein n=1 Tax=Leptobacterium flavescens TaxID=472055 RepID=A0A6P0UNE3_9FLAO|nr:hypothetical protein [Leptobacterium flavescens]NER13980.1 hypothetical protein [Leptobacterium flavescens]
MKKFLIKISVFFGIVVIIFSIVLMNYGGYIDYFYEKFTTPKVKSLILGDSRSMQGIQPSVINDYFKGSDYETPILNYSFTIAQIAYGPLYTESVKKKLDTTSTDGLFILTVNPWILSLREEDKVEEGIYFEQGKPPHNMTFVSHSPNFEYLVRNFNYFHFKSIVRRTSKMHKDGWLEESNLPKDSLTLNKWKEIQVELYSDYASRWKKSEFRLNHLQKLVEYLDKHGDVVIVRMPIDQKIMDIENNYWEGFDDDISRVASETNVKYINFSSHIEQYKTYDGNHLDKYGGVIYTRHLCDSIVKQQKGLSKAGR